MGLAKRAQEEAWETGYWRSFTDVGPECVVNPDLKHLVEQAANSTKCDYCGRVETDAFAAPLDVLLEAVVGGIRHEFEPSNGMYVFEGEQMVKTYTTEEVIRYEIGEEISDNEELLDEVIGSIEVEEWHEADPLSLGREKALLLGWEEFSKQIKHVTRYLFFPDSSERSEEVAPGQMMQELGNLVAQFGLVKPLPTGSAFVRARIHESDRTLDGPLELGPPPPAVAGANRMSPAGISMFYGSKEEATAVAEVMAHARPTTRLSDVRITCSTFVTKAPAWVLDLTDLPDIPGLFDPTQAAFRPEIRFLKDFVRDVAKPIVTDGREHFEYTPTQVLTEYFRFVHRNPEGGALLGITYPSSAEPGGISCVLFVEPEQCCTMDDPKPPSGCLLALDQGSVHTLHVIAG